VLQLRLPADGQLCHAVIVAKKQTQAMNKTSSKFSLATTFPPRCVVFDSTMELFEDKNLETFVMRLKDCM